MTPPRLIVDCKVPSTLCGHSEKENAGGPELPEWPHVDQFGTIVARAGDCAECWPLLWIYTDSSGEIPMKNGSSIPPHCRHHPTILVARVIAGGRRRTGQGRGHGKGPMTRHR